MSPLQMAVKLLAECSDFIQVRIEEEVRRGIVFRIRCTRCEIEAERFYIEHNEDADFLAHVNTFNHLHRHDQVPS